MPDEENQDDAALLRAYCTDRSEEAFRLLVERHLPTVWNTARRLVNGDSAMAEDISQEVFAHLAERASSLPPRVVLGGWLYRHTCFTAAKSVRRAVRRRARELTAATSMTAPVSDPWSGIAPHLDAALQSLSAADRNAVVLRFFEKRDYRSIGLALGTSEDAARMKTARAVEKLRSLLDRRGVVLSVAILASFLGGKAAAAPPAGMAAKVSASALASAGRVSIGILASLRMLLKRRRTEIAAGLILLMSGATLWYGYAESKAPPKTRISVAPQSTANGAKEKEISLLNASVSIYFVEVPESAAAALLNDRWNTDDDQALFDSLLKQAGNRSSEVVVSRRLTGECRDRKKTELNNTREISVPVNLDAGEGGIVRTDFGSRNIGSTAAVELRISDDRALCGLTLDIRHDFAEPLMHQWSASLANLELPDPGAGKMVECRPMQLHVRVLIETGRTLLAASVQLPLLPDSPAGTQARRLLTFVSATLTPQS